MLLRVLATTLTFMVSFDLLLCDGSHIAAVEQMALTSCSHGHLDRIGNLAAVKAFNVPQYEGSERRWQRGDSDAELCGIGYFRFEEV